MGKAQYTLEFEKPLRELEEQLENLARLSEKSEVDLAAEQKAIVAKIDATKRKIYTDVTPWQRVQIARHPDRPYALDYIDHMFQDFQELHGDRLFRDDQAIVGGTALLNGKPVMVIGQQKGRDTKENLKRNFGCPNPEGYRKALRLMRMADKFDLPIITIIDTPGAYPGIGSEERHVAEAIAVNIREMSDLKVPIISVVIGEGGSGGALGIAMSNIVLVLENAYYSVISPEGCAAILWKDRAHAPDAAEALKLNSSSLVDLGVADQVIGEPLGGAHRDYDKIIETVKSTITKHLKTLNKMPKEKLVSHRYEKFRQMGQFSELV